MKSPSTQTVCTLLSFSLLLGCQNTSLTESPAPEASQPSPAASAQPVAEASAAPATPSPTPTPEILSDLEYSARVMSAFEAQQKETIVWLQENEQPATVARLASPPTALSDAEESSSQAQATPSLSAELNKSMLSTIKAAAERLNTQLLDLPYPPRLREGHQKLLRLIALQSKYFDALEAFFEANAYQKVPGPAEKRQFLSADEMDEMERLIPETSTFMNELLMLSLAAETEALQRVAIYDAVTYRDRINPLFKASDTFKGASNMQQYMPIAELAKDPDAALIGLQQRQQEIEDNLAAIARIQPPAEYKDSHLLLYAQEKFNLLTIRICRRHFNAVIEPTKNVIESYIASGGTLSLETELQEIYLQMMQQLFEDPELLSLSMLMPLLHERAEAMQDKLKAF